MTTNVKRVQTVTLLCLPLMFLLSVCEGLPPSRHHVAHSPDTLLHVALRAEGKSIHVSWAVQPPADRAGEYQLSWVDQQNRQSNQYVVNKTETIIDGLKPCSRYTVSVTRVLKTGQLTTDTVEKSAITQNEAPPAVTGLLSRDITARGLSLSWERPSTECEITAYRIIYNGVAKWAPYGLHKNVKGIKKVAADNATEFKVNDLLPYSDYTLMVVAYTSGGKGASANLTTTTEQDVPEKPMDLITEKLTATSIATTWDKPAVVNGVLGPYYVSWYKDGERIGSERESLTAYTIAGLSPCVEYTIHVAASTAAGTGDYKEINQKTNDAAPPVPADTSCHSNEDQSVTMKWTIPDTACPITGYKVSHPKNSFDSTALETVDVLPSVLSANFSTQAGINFRACVTAVVAKTLIGSQVCCDQDTVSVKSSAPWELLYYKIATFCLIGLVGVLLSVLFLLLLFVCAKGKSIQHETDSLNGITQERGESPSVNNGYRTTRVSRNNEEINFEDGPHQQSTAEDRSHHQDTDAAESFLDKDRSLDDCGPLSERENVPQHTLENKEKASKGNDQNRSIPRRIQDFFSNVLE